MYVPHFYGSYTGDEDRNTEHLAKGSSVRCLNNSDELQFIQCLYVGTYQESGKAYRLGTTGVQ